MSDDGTRMIATACRDGVKPSDSAEKRPRLRRVAGALLLAGLVSGALFGCALNESQKAAAYSDPQIRALPLRVRSNETAKGYYALGIYNYYQGRLQAARKAFENSLRVDPSHIEALNGLAAVYDRLGEFEAAERIYRAALALDPKAAHVWTNLGYSMILRGDKQSALLPLRQALDIDPANAKARDYFSQLVADARLAKPAEGVAPAAAAEVPVAAGTSNQPVAASPVVESRVAATPLAPAVEGLIKAPVSPGGASGPRPAVANTIVASMVTPQGIVRPAAAVGKVPDQDGAASAAALPRATAQVDDGCKESGNTVTKAPGAPDAAASAAAIPRAAVQVDDGRKESGNTVTKAPGVPDAVAGPLLASPMLANVMSSVAMAAPVSWTAVDPAPFVAWEPALAAGQQGAAMEVNLRALAATVQAPPAQERAAEAGKPVSGILAGQWQYEPGPPALAGLRIEVSNGNGVEGMARALSGEMRQRGVNVARVTNAKPYNKQLTYIICKAELRPEAVRLADMLPGRPSVVSGSTTNRRVDMRVVLGADSRLAWNRFPGDRVWVAVMAK